MKTKVLKDPKKGRGLYAKEEFSTGEIIEVCELILMNIEEVRDTLESYVYQYSRNTVAIALGNGSLLNHCNKSNSEFYFNYKKRQLFIKARKRILPGEEITINYGYDSELKKRFNIF
jgi:uncharacterized protein